jgi:uncharacterized protein YkwD
MSFLDSGIILLPGYNHHPVYFNSSLFFSGIVLERDGWKFIIMQQQNGLLTRNSYFLLLAVLFLAACGTTNPAGTGASAEKEGPKRETPIALPKRETASVAPAIERDVLYYVNKHRETKGLRPLEFNAYIGAEARKHSTDMAQKLVPFGHDGLANRKNSITSQLKSITAVAENVARGPLTAQQVVNMWLKSPGHRRNIEGNFKYTGIGVARDQKSELYFTQIFAN